MTQAVEIPEAAFVPVQGEQYTIPWRYLSASEHRVVFRDADAVELGSLTVGSDFTIVPDADTAAGQGALTLLAAVPTGAVEIFVTRQTTLVQQYQASPGAEGVELALDRLQLAAQEVARTIRSVATSPSGAGDVRLPLPSDGRALIWSGPAGQMVNGPNANEIATAQGYALEAKGALDAAAGELSRRALSYDDRPAAAADMPNVSSGSVFEIAGKKYRKDPVVLATPGTALADQGVTGVRPEGPATPRHYGAVGDGEAYDTAAINRLLAAHEVSFWEGLTYLVDASDPQTAYGLTAMTGGTFAGQRRVIFGEGGKVIQPDTETDAYALAIAAQEVEILSLNFDGEFAYTTTTPLNFKHKMLGVFGFQKCRLIYSSFKNVANYGWHITKEPGAEATAQPTADQSVEVSYNLVEAVGQCTTRGTGVGSLNVESNVFLNCPINAHKISGVEASGHAFARITTRNNRVVWNDNFVRPRTEDDTADFSNTVGLSGVCAARDIVCEGNFFTMEGSPDVVGVACRMQQRDGNDTVPTNVQWRDNIFVGLDMRCIVTTPYVVETLIAGSYFEACTEDLIRVQIDGSAPTGWTDTPDITVRNVRAVDCTDEIISIAEGTFGTITLEGISEKFVNATPSGSAITLASAVVVDRLVVRDITTPRIVNIVPTVKTVVSDGIDMRGGGQVVLISQTTQSGSRCDVTDVRLDGARRIQIGRFDAATVNGRHITDPTGVSEGTAVPAIDTFSVGTLRVNGVEISGTDTAGAEYGVSGTTVAHIQHVGDTVPTLACADGSTWRNMDGATDYDRTGGAWVAR